MEIIQTSIAEISFNEEENILHIILREDADMNVENTREHYEKINALVGDKMYLALVDATNYYRVEKESWEYASSTEVISNRIAIAHYNSSAANTITTSFFKKMYNVSMPLQIFDTKEEALEWLRSFSLRSS
jgi:hypothetical protein